MSKVKITAHAENQLAVTGSFKINTLSGNQVFMSLCNLYVNETFKYYLT